MVKIFVVLLIFMTLFGCSKIGISRIQLDSLNKNLTQLNENLPKLDEDLSRLETKLGKLTSRLGG